MAQQINQGAPQGAPATDIRYAEFTCPCGRTHVLKVQAGPLQSDQQKCACGRTHHASYSYSIPGCVKVRTDGPATAYPTVSFNDDAGDSLRELLDQMQERGYIVKLNGTDVRFVPWESDLARPFVDTHDDAGSGLLVIDVDDDGIDLPDAQPREIAYADVDTIHVY